TSAAFQEPHGLGTRRPGMGRDGGDGLRRNCHWPGTGPGPVKSVDVELVAFGVLHAHRVVIEAVGAQGSSVRGPEIRQPPGLGVDSLRAGGERDRTVLAWSTAAADVDVEVEAVLDHLGVRHHMEPDAGAVTAGIDDAVGADSQLTVGKPDVAP